MVEDNGRLYSKLENVLRKESKCFAKLNMKRFNFNSKIQWYTSCIYIDKK